jgi:hypothetical protein
MNNFFWKTWEFEHKDEFINILKILFKRKAFRDVSLKLLGFRIVIKTKKK